MTYDLPTDPEVIVEENREMLLRVLRHSSTPFARAAAWTLLDAGLSDPELEQLHAELDALVERDGGG